MGRDYERDGDTVAVLASFSSTEKAGVMIYFRNIVSKFKQTISQCIIAMYLKATLMTHVCAVNVSH